MSALLKVEGLRMHFPVKRGLFQPPGTVRAVDGVDFELAQGETLGLVGESGCGKTTLGLTAMRLYEPTSGSVTFDGIDITRLNEKEMHNTRRQLQMTFQDLLAALDPRMTVEEIIREPLDIHRIWAPKERTAEIFLNSYQETGTLEGYTAFTGECDVMFSQDGNSLIVRDFKRAAVFALRVPTADAEINAAEGLGTDARHGTQADGRAGDRNE